MMLLLLACLTPKYVGTIDQIDSGFCIVEFENTFTSTMCPFATVK